jgi:hypothetical protein
MTSSRGASVNCGVVIREEDSLCLSGKQQSLGRLATQYLLIIAVIIIIIIIIIGRGSSSSSVTKTMIIYVWRWSFVIENFQVKFIISTNKLRHCGFDPR